MPNGDCGDGVLNPHPKDQVADKFWSQRRRLFTRFDQGIQLDKESWFSVTPEAIADHIAARMVQSRENLIIMDPFSGCGGNSIAFAKRDEVALVVCVDTDLEKLKKAAANALIYEIPPEKMVLIHEDACDIMSFFRDGKLAFKTEEVRAEVTDLGGEDCKYQIGNRTLLPERLDMIFLSPPWGGMDYLKVGKRNYDLTSIQLPINGTSVSGEDLLDMAATSLGHKPVTYFLPRNVNGIKLARSALKAGYEGPVVMEQNVLNGKLKTVTAYIGL
jgi:trimethylguanosine synthase